MALDGFLILWQDKHLQNMTVVQHYTQKQFPVISRVSFTDVQNFGILKQTLELAFLLQVGSKRK
jgi:hypothetical protein